ASEPRYGMQEESSRIGQMPHRALDQIGTGGEGGTGGARPDRKGERGSGRRQDHAGESAPRDAFVRQQPNRESKGHAGASLADEGGEGAEASSGEVPFIPVAARPLDESPAG